MIAYAQNKYSRDRLSVSQRTDSPHRAADYNALNRARSVTATDRCAEWTRATPGDWNSNWRRHGASASGQTGRPRYVTDNIQSFSGYCCSYLQFRLISCLKWLMPCGYSRFVSLWWLHENVL